MARWASALALMISLGGCFGDGHKDRAYEFVISELQAKQGLFKDQYDLSMPFDNGRGSVVVVEITDDEIERKDGFDPHFAFILQKDQNDQGFYEHRYSRVFFKKEPSDDEVEELARDDGLL